MRGQAWSDGTVARLMRPFNCRAACASFSHLLPRYLSSSSSYSIALSCLRRHLASSSASSEYSDRKNTHTLMEVVQEVLKHGSAHGVRAAIRADKKSYSLFQLIASAMDVHNILCSKNIARNGTKDASFEGINGTRFLHGARIGIVAKPSPEFVAGIFGTWLSGGVAVPLALSYPEAELLHVMNDSDISMILSTKEHHDIMDGISTKCSVHCSLLPSVASIPTEIDYQECSGNDVTSSASSLIAEINSTNKIKGDDPALILYTSGTTGKPKGVVHTHKGILSQVQILSEAWGYQREDQFLHCLPLHHVHGLFNALFAPLYSGSVVEFIPKFSVRGVWQRWRESYPKDSSTNDNAITVFTGVPTMYTRLLQGYDTMDPDQQCASSYAAKQLRLMALFGSAFLDLRLSEKPASRLSCFLDKRESE